MTKSMSKKRLKVGEEVMSNEDLLFEVLLRLPAKPLVRFKCVSKSWLSIISTPEFGSKQTRINPKSSMLGVYYIDSYNYKHTYVSLDQANQTNIPSLAFIKGALPGKSPDGADRSSIMHACNGLLLCRYTCKSPYFVCNITTRTTTILSQHVVPSSGWYPRDDCAYLVFDPSKSPHFKVVLLDTTVSKHDTICHYDENYQEKTAYCSGFCYELDVYSSDTGVWKHMFFRACHGSPLSFKAVCDGSLHWITTKRVHVRFEVDTLKLISNPMPSNQTLDVEKIRYFGECCGCLFLIYIPWRSAKPFLVFELDKDHSSWKMKYSVDMSLLRASYPDNFEYPEPSKRRCIPAHLWKFFVLCVVNDDEINGLSVLLIIPGKIVSYNLMKKSFKVLQDFSMKEFPLLNGYQSVKSFPFISTLSPV